MSSILAYPQRKYKYDVAYTYFYFLGGLTCRVQIPSFQTFKDPKNRFQGINSASLCSLAGRYDIPIPTRFLVPIDCLKIPAQGA
jgi:hypothetical protein